MQRSSYRRGEFFIGASRARPFSATYTRFTSTSPLSSLSTSSFSRSIFFRADTSAKRSTVKFSKRVTPRCGNAAWKTLARDVPHEKRDRPISDSPTVCMHLVFELRYIYFSAASGGEGNVTKLPMKRTTRRHFCHLETVRLEITTRRIHHVPILLTVKFL